ncbi:MAG: B12-binding domain-containing radical SAM protein [Deltaproteobacteria bacterium]|nr:B12-binding domain-containing radical SAM protein [Deltaproteobacteria bacterium]
MNLSSILKHKGIDSILVYSNSKSDIIQKINAIQPDIIAYSLMYGYHWRYIELSKEIKQKYPNIYQIAGGPYTTFYPESINELPLGAIAIGEADISLADFVGAFKGDGPSADHTRGFHYRSKDRVIKGNLQNLLDNLDELPFPDREIFYEQDSLLRNQEFKSFLSGRGCPFPCTYCFNHKFNTMFKGKGKVMRKKSADYFIAEIKDTKEKYGCQIAIFEDDIFVMKKDWLEKFCRNFKKEINIPYICYVRADIVDEGTLRLLKESGCHIVRMAIETGNEKLRNTILKRNMKDETIIKAADLIHKYGMKLSVSNMVGLPTETLDALEDTLNLNIRCRPEHPSAQFFMPYPDMELSKIAIETGYFSEERMKEIPKNTWKNTPLLFDKETKRVMVKTQKIFPLIVKYPSIKKYTKLFFLLPDQLLYLVSVVTKITIVRNYFPPTKVTLLQRLRVLRRFFSFYG